MVDDTRLELVTSRTSSGCATSCANRPNQLTKCILHDEDEIVKQFFAIFSFFLKLFPQAQYLPDMPIDRQSEAS